MQATPGKPLEYLEHSSLHFQEEGVLTKHMLLVLCAGSGSSVIVNLVVAPSTPAQASDSTMAGKYQTLSGSYLNVNTSNCC